MLASLLPRDDRYRHRHGSAGHGADHVLPALVSPSVVLPVLAGVPRSGPGRAWCWSTPIATTRTARPGSVSWPVRTDLFSAWAGQRYTDRPSMTATMSGKPTTATALSAAPFTRRATTPRATSTPIRSSGVSPTRKSHQNRPKATSQRYGSDLPADGWPPLPTAAAGLADAGTQAAGLAGPGVVLLSWHGPARAAPGARLASAPGPAARSTTA